MNEWLKMGGYGFYVWSSYGMLAAAVLIELLYLRRRRRGAWQRFDDLRAEYGEPQGRAGGAGGSPNSAGSAMGGTSTAASTRETPR